MSKKKIESESFIKKLKRKIDSPSFITELGIVHGVLMIVFLFGFDIYLEDYYSSFSSWYRTFIVKIFFWGPNWGFSFFGTGYFAYNRVFYEKKV